MGGTGCPEPGEGLPILGIAILGSPAVAPSLRGGSFPSSPFGMLFNSTSASCILASWHAPCFYFSWMMKPVDYWLFFPLRGIPQLHVSSCTEGGIRGSHSHCGSLMLTLFPNHRLSLETPLNLAGKIEWV